MLKRLTLLTLLVLTAFLNPQANARIVEITTMNEILPEITPETLVLFDLDDTCIASIHMLGSMPWWTHFLQKMQTAQIDTKTTYNVLFPLMGKIIENVPNKAVEDQTPQIIRSLQNQNILVLGLTARMKDAPYDANFAFTTHSQLQKIGINFSDSRMPPGLNPQNPPKAFAFGIIFTDHKLKGPVLKKFLEDIHFRPEKIIMVEDLHTHLESLEDAMHEMGISFVGFRYGRMDQAHAGYDPLIVNLQLKALLTQGYIPTDEQAALWKTEMLWQKPYLSHDFYLDEIIMNIKRNAEG